MLKVIIILDQIQAGLGGKEKADTPYGGKRIAMGSADTIERQLNKKDGVLLGTFYCGTDYYEKDKSIVQRKFAKMAEKMGANLVILGPTFDYPEFSKMACEIAEYIQNETDIQVIVASAYEKNEELINQYKSKLYIVKTPKKGGTGLNQALDNIISGSEILTTNGDKDKFKTEFCY